MQRLNDAKKEFILNEMSERQGEILNAIIRRKEGSTVYVEISGTQMEGVMMQTDQVPTEIYNVGDVIKVYIKKIRDSVRGGAQVVVSRSSAGFVRRLFELEVPEIKAGLVKIMSIVREGGFRTKLAVYSEDPNVDAVGACIGNKGVRVNAVVAELGGEKSTSSNGAQTPSNTSHALSAPHRCSWFPSTKRKRTRKSSFLTKNSALQSAETVRTHVLPQNLPAGKSTSNLIPA